jgi:hypothetical protein
MKTLTAFIKGLFKAAPSHYMRGQMFKTLTASERSMLETLAAKEAES